MEWIWIYAIWLASSSLGLLYLAVTAFRRRAITPDDLPPTPRKLIGLIVLSIGPIKLSNILQLFEIAQFNLDGRMIITILWSICVTALFILMLITPSSHPGLEFDQKLFDRLRRK